MKLYKIILKSLVPLILLFALLYAYLFYSDGDNSSNNYYKSITNNNYYNQEIRKLKKCDNKVCECKNKKKPGKNPPTGIKLSD